MFTTNKISQFKAKLLLIVSSILIGVLVISFVQSASFEVANQPEPTVSGTSVVPGNQDRGSSVVISSTVVDVSGVIYVRAQIKNGGGTTVANINLFDDGAHNDGAAGNDVYGNTLTIPATLPVGNYKVFITASDTLGNIYQTGVTTPFSDAGPRIEEANFNVTTPAVAVSPIADARVGNAPGPVGTSATVDKDVDTVYFDGSTFSSDLDGSIVNYEWDFDGDGTYDWNNAATGITTHIYTIAGTYTAQLRVIDNDGMTDMDTVVVTVNAAALITASIISPKDEDAFSSGDLVSFDSSAAGGTAPYTYSWNSNLDGNIGNLQAFNKNNLSVGDHIITLIITDAAATIDTDSIDIHIPPDSFDWRNVNGQNWMTSVKNQICNDCWAFATAGSMEAKYNIEQNNSTLDIDLSEQYLVSSCHSFSDCGGGTCAFSFIKDTGIASENCYSYLGANSVCPAVCDDASPIDLWKVSSNIHITTLPPFNKAKLQNALVHNGPLYVEINVGGGPPSPGNDKDGCAIWTCGGGFPNHAVVLVGYDNVNQYWIIKNSWGGFVPLCSDGYESLDYGTCLLGTGLYGDYAKGILSP